jgi:hypothetical protein
MRQCVASGVRIHIPAVEADTAGAHTLGTSNLRRGPVQGKEGGVEMRGQRSCGGLPHAATTTIGEYEGLENVRQFAIVRSVVERMCTTWSLHPVAISEGQRNNWTRRTNSNLARRSSRKPPQLPLSCQKNKRLSDPGAHKCTHISRSPSQKS